MLLRPEKLRRASRTIENKENCFTVKTAFSINSAASASVIIRDSKPCFTSSSQNKNTVRLIG